MSSSDWMSIAFLLCILLITILNKNKRDKLKEEIERLKGMATNTVIDHGQAELITLSHKFEFRPDPNMSLGESTAYFNHHLKQAKRELMIEAEKFIEIQSYNIFPEAFESASSPDNQVFMLRLIIKKAH